MNEFISKDSSIVVNVDHAEAYIPADSFSEEDKQSSIASAYGEGFRILGLFNMRLSNSQSEKDLRSQPLRTFSFPNMIDTHPSSNTDEILQLTPGSEPIRYKVLHYTRGDIMMANTMPQSGDNAVKFMKAVIGGKIPNTLPYNDIFTAWVSNLDSNGTDAGIPFMYLQAIISELCRSKKDHSVSFRKVYGKDMNNQDYVITNMRGTAAYSSVFAAQTFEDMGRMLTTSINMTRRDIKQTVSPIEKVLYM